MCRPQRYWACVRPVFWRADFSVDGTAREADGPPAIWPVAQENVAVDTRIYLCYPLDSTDTDSYELRHLFKLSLANTKLDQRIGCVLLRLSRFAET